MVITYGFSFVPVNLLRVPNRADRTKERQKELENALKRGEGFIRRRPRGRGIKGGTTTTPWEDLPQQHRETIKRAGLHMAKYAGVEAAKAAGKVALVAGVPLVGRKIYRKFKK